jgi:hypothetical protein
LPSALKTTVTVLDPRRRWHDPERIDLFQAAADLAPAAHHQSVG